MTATATTPGPGGAGATPVLEARDVAVHFGGVKAVDGLSFTLTPGKIFGILGPNGSGKSTLLGAITRLMPLTRGELLLDGEEYHQVPAVAAWPRRRVARTFQTVRLLPDLTVLDNIQLGADRGRTTEADRRSGACSGRILCGRGESRRRSREAIARTRLDGFEELLPVASCPTARSAGSRSPGRSRCGRGCCCSTSRPPA